MLYELQSTQNTTKTKKKVALFLTFFAPAVALCRNSRYEIDFDPSCNWRSDLHIFELFQLFEGDLSGERGFLHKIKRSGSGEASLYQNRSSRTSDKEVLISS